MITRTIYKNKVRWCVGEEIFTWPYFFLKKHLWSICKYLYTSLTSDDTTFISHSKMTKRLPNILMFSWNLSTPINRYIEFTAYYAMKNSDHNFTDLLWGFQSVQSWWGLEFYFYQWYRGHCKFHWEASLTMTSNINSHSLPA